MPVDGFTETMNTPNVTVFQPTYAQDDRSLENEVMTILLASAVRFIAMLTDSQHRKQLFPEKDLIFSNHMDSKTALTVLICANEGKGFVDSRDSNGEIDTLEVGRDTFVHQYVQMRRFFQVWKD